jgi:glycosyltransferase involved in cell wall biosynthesis
VVVVDDESRAGTAARARAAGAVVVAGAPLPAGWAGKVSAMAQGVRYATEHGAAPDYLLFQDADIAALVGRRPPRLRLPRLAVYPLAVVAEAAARITGRTPFVTRDSLRMARYRMFFTDAKARAELGYTARPYREGLADAILWFREAGYLK